MAFTSLARLAAALISAQWVGEVSAHGKLTVPASRNEIDGASGCAHCLNTGGPCGDGSSGKFLNYFAGPQATWTAGSIVPITVTVTAHHRGHYEFRICDQVLNSSVADPDGCLNKWVLERARPEEAGFTDCQPGDQRAACVPFDSQHPERWYLPPADEVSLTHTIYFKVPAGLQCEVCTLQWHWWSANSCIPASDYGCYKQVLQSNGYWVGSKSAWWTAGEGSCPGGCGSNVHCGCGEQFWNCADITVLPADGGAGTTTVASTITSSTSTTSTTFTTTPQASTTTQTTTTVPPAQGCKAASGAGEYGATDSRCTALCGVLAAGQWPCGHGHACDCSGMVSTTVTTTASALPTSTATSTTAGGRVCMPTPGLPSNGATAEYCAQCAAGYQWWPCNTDPAICTCSGDSLAEVSSHVFQDPAAARSSRRQSFLGTSLLQDGAVTAHAGAKLSKPGDEL